MAVVQQYEVRAGICDGDIGRFMNQARQILLPILGRDIVINSRGDARNIRALEDGNFYIHIWASPSQENGSGNEHRSGVLFGLNMNNDGWNWFGASGQGEVFRAPENDAIVAELVGDNLYIFPPLHDSRLADVAPEIFGHILSLVVESGKVGCSLDPEERAARMREIKRVSFVKMCASRLDHNVGVTESAVRDKEARLEKFRTQLLNGFLQHEAARVRLRQPIEPVDGEKFGREFDGLLRVPKVRRVVVNGHNVEVYTDMIYCRDPRSKKLHELGKFRICVNVFAGEVLWFNLTRQINGFKKNMHAPHVFDGGRACLGSAAEPLAELLSNFEVAATVMYAIQFLESVNVDDVSGVYIDRWPLAANQLSV